MKAYIDSARECIRDVREYASKLNTRAKLALATIGLAVLTSGAEYVLNRGVPSVRYVAGQSRGDSNEFPDTGRKERLEAQRQELKCDWMFEK